MKVQFKYKSTTEKNDEVELIMTTRITITRQDICEITKEAYSNHYDPICDESDIEEFTDKVCGILDEQLYQEVIDELAAENVTTKMVSVKGLQDLYQKAAMKLIKNEECE